MRLAIIDDAPIWTDGQRYSMPTPMNRFYEQMARELGPVLVCGPMRLVSTEMVEKGCIVDPSLVQYLPRPYFESPVHFFRRAPWLLVPTAVAIWRAVGRSSFVCLRLPSVIGLLSYLFILLRRRPRVVQIKGSWSASVGERFGGILGLVGRAVVGLFSATDFLMARRSTTLVHTSEHHRRASGRRNSVHVVSVSLVGRRDTWRREDTCRDGTPRLLYVGRASPAKGLEYLLRALAEMPEPRPTLCIVGTGPSLPQLRQLAADLNLDSLVSFEGNIGYGEALLDVYRGSDVFVLPSVTEGIPKVLFEAMASGTPIVASAVGGIPQIVQHGLNGLLVEPRSVEQLRDTLCTVLRDGDLRRRLIANAYETAARYSIEATAGTFADIIRRETC